MRTLDNRCSCPRCRDETPRSHRTGEDLREDRCSCPQCRQADAYAERQDDADACGCRRGGGKVRDGHVRSASDDSDFDDSDFDEGEFDLRGDDELDEEADELEEMDSDFELDFSVRRLERMGEDSDLNTSRYRTSPDVRSDSRGCSCPKCRRADALEANVDEAVDDESDDLDSEDLDDHAVTADRVEFGDDDELDASRGDEASGGFDFRDDDELDSDDLDGDAETIERGLRWMYDLDSDSADLVGDAHDQDEAEDFDADDQPEREDSTRDARRGWLWMYGDRGAEAQFEFDLQDELNRMARSDDDRVDEDEDDAVLEDQLDAMDAEDDLAVDEEQDAELGALREAWDVGQFGRALTSDDDDSLMDMRGELDLLETPWRKPDHDGRYLKADELSRWVDPTGGGVTCQRIHKLGIWQGKQDHAAQHLSDDEYIRLTCEAVNIAAGWLGLMRERINHIYAGGNLLYSRRRWMSDPTFPYWFGSGMRTTQQIRALRRKIVRMHSWFTPGKGSTGLRLVVVKERGMLTTGAGRTHLCTLGNAAYTISPVVYLCPTYFSNNGDSRAELLVHELTHRLVQATSASMGFGFFPGSQALWSMAPAMWATVDHPCVTGRDGQCRRVSGQSDHNRRLARHLARHRPLAARRSPTNWAIVAREIGTGMRRHPV